jgi:DNA-binding response OmpR family regulator
MPRLLVVDDHPAIREFVYDFFSAQGYEVSDVAASMEALRRLRQERPHLMLLDVVLPDMSGLFVLREAKRIDPTVGVVMVTGLDYEGLGKEALRASACAYLTKPVDLRHLERVLRNKLSTMTSDAMPLRTLRPSAA